MHTQTHTHAQTHSRTNTHTRTHSQIHTNTHTFYITVSLLLDTFSILGGYNVTAWHCKQRIKQDQSCILKHFHPLKAVYESSRIIQILE